VGVKLHRPIIGKRFILPGVVIPLLLAGFVLVRSNQTVTLVLGGDLMLAREGIPIVTNVDGFGDAATIIHHADLAIANLESPLTTVGYVERERPGYNLCADASAIPSLNSAGFDGFSVANNHGLDCGENGVEETSSQLAAAGLFAIGAGQDPVILEVKGQRIAFLAYEDVLQPLDLGTVVEEIKQARSLADILIVSLHWGNEYQAGPDSWQQELAQRLADAGVDVIWGHHPHVLQPMQWIKSSDETHETLVIYSLGNLYSDQFMLEDARRTALVKLEVRHAKIAAVEVYPLVLGMDTGRLVNADAGESEIILDRLKWMPSE